MSHVAAGFGLERFVATFFDAAVDAARGRFWPREGSSGSLSPRYPTQARRIRRAATILGLALVENDPSLVELIDILKVPGQVLLDSSRQFLNASGSSERGRAVCNVLLELHDSFFLFQRLAAAGHAVRLWPPLFIWDDGQRALTTSSFPNADPRGSP